MRPPHGGELLALAADRSLPIDFIEALSENAMVPGGPAPRVLSALREHLPVVLHGVSLDVGSTDPLDATYLEALQTLARRFEPAWISDHLCWTGVGDTRLHDLVPLPYTEEAIDHVSKRVAQVQDRLGRRIALENVSSYLTYVDDAMPEWQFLVEIAERADCGILLDVNNVFVSAHNHGYDATEFIDAIPGERVFQLHMAGHSASGPLLIDTHDHAVREEVWSLYAYTIDRLGPVSTLVEWDANIPPLATLLTETERARAIRAASTAAQKLGGRAAS